MSKIYLDNNASTAIDPRVKSVILKSLESFFSNPSSSHTLGQETRNQISKARQAVASFLGVKQTEIVFSSGGTESLNMAIMGFFDGSYSGHIITSNVEHSSVYSPIKRLEKYGCETTFLNPGLHGGIKAEDVLKSLKPNTKLIALMAVNNETGVKSEINQIAEIAKTRQIPFVVDGVAWLGKELFNIPAGVTIMCFSGHKFHAPKGIGFSFIRQGTKLSPLILGGDQEFSKRGGTENVSGILGLAEAVSALKSELPQASEKMKSLRDYFETEIMVKLSDVTVNGEGPRVVNTSNLSFAGVDGESLLIALDMAGLAASHGSACASGSLEPSRILLNMGLSPEKARTSIRFSLSRFTTKEEIDQAIQIVIKTVNHLRK